MALLKLMLDPNNPYNCTLTGKGEEHPSYTVSTELVGEKRHKHMTVKGKDGGILAKLKPRDLRSDEVIFGGHPPVAFSKWVHRSRLSLFNRCAAPFSSANAMAKLADSCGKMKDDTGRIYEWRRYEPGDQLELWAPHFSKTAPVLRAIKEGKYEPSAPAQLHIDMAFFTSEEKPTLNMAVVSFLFLEAKHRISESNLIPNEKPIVEAVSNRA